MHAVVAASLRVMKRATWEMFITSDLGCRERKMKRPSLPGDSDLLYQYPTLLFTKHHLKRWQLMNSIPSFLCKKIIIAALRKVQRNHFLFPKQPRFYTNRVTRNAGSSVSTASFSICDDM